MTEDADVYAIGDCASYYNPYYDRHIRLEPVSNASDHAKTAAASLCGKDPKPVGLPWFWSDQYHVKLRIAGLSDGYYDLILRNENTDDERFSAWYFKDDQLLAVDAVNNMKAYVVGTKLIKSGEQIDKSRLKDPGNDLKTNNILK